MAPRGSQQELATNPERPELQHEFGVALKPPGPGDLQSHLEDMLVTALHLAGANWQSGGSGARVVQVALAFAGVPAIPFAEAAIVCALGAALVLVEIAVRCFHRT